MKTKFNGFLTLLLALVMQISFSQHKIVSGTVSDESGILPGVSVLKKDTTLGTETDFDGKYSIQAKAGDVLVFSYIGYKIAEKTVGSYNILDVTLKEGGEVLDEIVITGVAKRTFIKKLGFSLTKINEESLQEVPAVDAANALRGKISGVRIVSPSGNPFANTSIRLRGSTAILGSQSPLILVDGIITDDSSLRDIPVETIASIEVIKGAAGSSLYGSLAANGVIQIITKKGNGKLKVSLKSEYGFSEIANKYPLATKHQYLLDPLGVRNGDWDRNPATPDTSNFGFDLSTGNRINDPDGLFDNEYLTQNYDNINNIFTTQPFITNTISLSGSSGDSNYFVSAQNNQIEGIIEGLDPFKRNSFRVNFNTKMTDKLNFKFTGGLTKRIGVSVIEQGQGSNIFYSGLVVEPFINFLEKDDEGKYSNTLSGYSVQGVAFQNPLYVLRNRSDVLARQRLLLGGTLTYDFNENFSFVVSQSLDQSDASYEGFVKRGFVTPTPSPTLNNGSITKNKTTFSTLVSSAQLNYGAQVSKDFNLGISLKYLFENRQLETLNANGYNLTSGSVKTIQNTPKNNQTIYSYYQKKIARNFFLNADLDYQDMIILNGLVRLDQSSLFGSEERDKIYYRAALAYRLSEGLNMNGVDELKFRIAYGTAGQRPPVFNAQYETFTVTSAGNVPDILGNKKLKPSETRELEVGLDFDFLNRFSFSTTYSNSKTLDAMVLVPLTAIKGFSHQWQNIGQIESKYIEFSLSGDIVKNSNFNWNFQLNFDTGTQKITDLNGVAPFTRSVNIKNESLGAVNIFRVEEGLPYGTMYGSKFATSIAQLSVDASGNVLNENSSGGTKADYSINEHGYVVLTSAIGTADEAPLLLFDEETQLDLITEIGNTNPDFNVGFSNTFRYRNLSLYVLADWQQGGEIYNYTKQLLYLNQRHQDLQNFAMEGKNQNYAQKIYNKSNPTDFFVEDGTYVKIREIALAYTLDFFKLNISDNTGIDSIKFGISGRNLFTFTNYTGFDPEVAIGTNSTNFKLDEFSYPNFRSYSFSIEVKF